MQNLLPKVSAKITKVEESKLSFWNPQQADPQRAVISQCLQKEFTVDIETLQRYRENVLPKREPNYVPPEIVARTGKSQINEENRGIPDDVLISTKQFIPEKKVDEKRLQLSSERETRPLVVNIMNGMMNSIDLFVQCQNRVIATALRHNKEFIKSLDGPKMNREQLIADDYFYVFTSTMNRATVTMTNRQEIKDYRFFSNQKIGLEVELINGRVGQLSFILFLSF
jgi:hypothetical protein